MHWHWSTTIHRICLGAISVCIDFKSVSYWIRSKIIWFVWGMTFLCGGLTAGLLSLDTLRSDEAPSVLFITLELSGRPDVLITRLSDCWNISLHEAVITSSFILLTFKSPQKLNVLQFNDCFLKYSSMVATRHLLIPRSHRSWLALLGFYNWWRALDQQFSSRNYMQ